MADATIELEARLKNLLSPELERVKTSMRDTQKETKKTSNEVDHFGKQMGEATNFSKQWGIGFKTIIGGMIGAQAIIGATRNLFQGISQFVKDSAAEFIKYNANHPDVQRIQEIDGVWKRLQERLGGPIIQSMTTIKSIGAEAAKAALNLVPETSMSPRERYSALEKSLRFNQKELDSIRKQIDEGTFKGSIQEASQQVTDLDRKIESLNVKINKARGELGLKRVGEGGGGAQYATDAEMKAKDATEKANAERIKQQQQLAKQRLAVQDSLDKEMLAAQIAAIDNQYIAELYKVQEWEAARIEEVKKQGSENKAAQEEIAAQITQVHNIAAIQREEVRQREADDMKKYNEQLLNDQKDAHEREVKEAQAAAKEMVRIEEEKARSISAANYSVVQSVIDAAQTLLSISGATKDELKPIYIALAIVEGVAATARAIKLAVDESSSYYEAVAKSAAAVITYGALTAANVASIASAATGADFVADKPTLLMVGDNPTQRERVQVTPIGSPNINGPQESGGGKGDTYNFYGITEDRLVDSLRSLKRAGKLDAVLSGRYA